LELAQLLRWTKVEHHVFRAAVLAIVAILVAGPSTPGLCRVSCDPVEAATDGCHADQESTSGSVSGTDDCRSLVFGGAVLVNEDGRAGVSDRDARPAVVAARHRSSPAAPEALMSGARGSAWLLPHQPRITILRL
jgi:hypothetical protein